MNTSKLQNLLNLNWTLLNQALPSFQRSLVKCQNIDFSPPISFEKEETLDSLSFKFSRVSAIYTQKVLLTNKSYHTTGKNNTKPLIAG